MVFETARLRGRCPGTCSGGRWAPRPPSSRATWEGQPRHSHTRSAQRVGGSASLMQCSLGWALWRTELARLTWCQLKEIKGKDVHHLSLRFCRSPSSPLWDEEGEIPVRAESKEMCMPDSVLHEPGCYPATTLSHVSTTCETSGPQDPRHLEVWAHSRIQFHLAKTGGEKHSNCKKTLPSPGPPICQTVQMGGCAAWRNACRWFTQRVGLLRRQVCGKIGFPPLQGNGGNLRVGSKAQVHGAPKLSVVGNLTYGEGAGQPFLPGKLSSRASFQMLPNVAWLAPIRPLADATRGLAPR